MTTRREVSAARREQDHTARIEAAETSTGRLWQLLNWLVAEARRSGRIEEISTEVRRIIDRLRAGEPLNNPAPEAPPADSAAWYDIARRQTTPHP